MTQDEKTQDTPREAGLYVRAEFTVRVAIPYKEGENLRDTADGMAQIIVDAVKPKASPNAIELSCTAEKLSVFAPDWAEA